MNAGGFSQPKQHKISHKTVGKFTVMFSQLFSIVPQPRFSVIRNVQEVQFMFWPEQCESRAAGVCKVSVCPKIQVGGGWMVHTLDFAL